MTKTVPHADYQRLLKLSTDVAEVMRVIVTMSDDAVKVSRWERPKMLTRLHASLQSNRPRLVVLVDQLADLVEKETGKKVERAS